MNIYGSRDDYVSPRGDTSSDGYYYTSSSLDPSCHSALDSAEVEALVGGALGQGGVRFR